MRNRMNESDCNCPRCGKSWQGMTLYSIFYATNKKAYPNKTQAEINRFVKAQLKENGKTGDEHVTGLIQAGGNWRCPQCGLLVAEKDVWRLVDNKNNRFRACLIGMCIRLKSILHLKTRFDEWLVRRYMLLNNEPTRFLSSVRRWVLFSFYYLLHKEIRK